MKQPASAKPRYVTKDSGDPIRVTEPFRVFFPLGILASVLGVLIWPLFYAEVWPFPPHLQHPRMMIFGFGVAFVMGFLGTAWPRFLEGEAIKRYELLILVLLWTAAQIAYSVHQLRAGDCLTAMNLLWFLIVLGIRAGGASSIPPPGFALAFVAVVSGFLVSAVWAFFPTTPGAELYLFTKLIAFQGFLLLPLLGVGSYLFPRFFAGEGEKPVTAKAPHRAIGVWGTAALILISFVFEANGWIRTGNGLRLGALLFWAGLAAPAVWKAPIKSTRAWALRLGIAMIGLSFLIRTIWPGPAYAFEHLLFLGGFGLSLLLVADRVSIGHGGDSLSLHAISKTWRWIVWLVLLAAATRVSADFKASILVSHQIYSAILWASIVVIWGRFHIVHWKSES